MHSHIGFGLLLLLLPHRSLGWSRCTAPGLVHRMYMGRTSWSYRNQIAIGTRPDPRQGPQVRRPGLLRPERAPAGRLARRASRGAPRAARLVQTNAEVREIGI